MSEWYTLTKNNNKIDISCSRNTSSMPRAVVAMVRGQKSYRPLLINQLGVSTHEDSSGGSIIVDWDTNAVTLEVPYATAVAYDNSLYTFGVVYGGSITSYSNPYPNMVVDLYSSVERIGYKNGAQKNAIRYTNGNNTAEYYYIYWCRSYEIKDNQMVPKNITAILSETAGFYRESRFIKGTLPDGKHTATELDGIYTYDQLLNRFDNSEVLANIKTAIDTRDRNNNNTTYDYKCVVVRTYPVQWCTLSGIYSGYSYITNLLIAQENGWIFDTSIVFPWMDDGISFGGTGWVSDSPDGSGNESSLIDTGTGGIKGSRYGGQASCTRTITDAQGNTTYTPTVSYSASGPIGLNNNYTGTYDENNRKVTFVWGEVGSSQQDSNITATLQYTNVLRADGTSTNISDSVSLRIDNGTY